ncbi:MAG: Alcohol dehydrogenase GroES domain protein [Edaphobacter sp.]|nr:Alcohol dehydrogenase GroES domain protein [Edaphobacter sp.]
MGIVEEVGKEVTNLRQGDRVVVPFTIACGNYLFCKKIWAACDNSNPNAHLMEAAYGYRSIQATSSPIASQQYVEIMK